MGWVEQKGPVVAATAPCASANSGQPGVATRCGMYANMELQYLPFGFFVAISIFRALQSSPFHCGHPSVCYQPFQYLKTSPRNAISISMFRVLAYSLLSIVGIHPSVVNLSCTPSPCNAMQTHGWWCLPKVFDPFVCVWAGVGFYCALLECSTKFECMCEWHGMVPE